MSYQEDRFAEIANAIREKDGTTETIKATDFATRILEIPSGGGVPPTAGGMFTGATIPLTYRNNTHEYENVYNYSSAYAITISGLEGRATITGNGTNNVSVAFDVSSSTSSLKNFTITLESDEQTLTYKGLHAHYGTTVTGCLTLAYTNIPRTGTGTIGTEYKFIETTATDLPYFSLNTTLWNTIYSYQVLNTLVGNVTSIGDFFLNACYSFNQPLDLSNVTSIGNDFLSSCSSFNQPLDISNVTSISSDFLYNCYSFNQPLDLSNVTSIGNDFLSGCYCFNQPLDLSNVTSISHNFLKNCYSFNQPLDLSNVTSISSDFLYNCYSFNQPLDLSNVTSIGGVFLNICRSFNQPLDISNVTSIGNDFLSSCSSFNQPLDLSNVTSIGNDFLSGCYCFNQPLDLSNVTSISSRFLKYCSSFNQPLDLSNVTSISVQFLNSCSSFNQNIIIPSGLTSISTSFLYNCYSLSTITYNATVFPTDDNALAQYQNSKTSTNGAGILVFGTRRAGLLTALPNRTSNPYRKLIDGGAD